MVRKGEGIDWLEADDNPWGVRVLDVRPVTHTMLLVTGNEQLASNAVSWKGDDGTSFIGVIPQLNRVVETNLRFPIDRRLRLIAWGTPLTLIVVPANRKIASYAW